MFGTVVEQRSHVLQKAYKSFPSGSAAYANHFWAILITFASFSNRFGFSNSSTNASSWTCLLSPSVWSTKTASTTWRSFPSAPNEQLLLFPLFCTANVTLSAVIKHWPPGNDVVVCVDWSRIIFRFLLTKTRFLSQEEKRNGSGCVLVSSLLCTQVFLHSSARLSLLHRQVINKH